MVPIVAGLLMGAALGGGIAALQKKDVLQGALMGGIGGALGGAFMPAAAAAPVAGAVEGAAASGFGATGIAGGSAGAGVLPAAQSSILAGAPGAAGSAFPLSSSAFPLTSNVASSAFPLSSSAFPLTGSVAGGATGGAGSGGMFSGGIGNFLSQNKYALAGGALGGMMAPGEEPDKPDEGNIRDYTFNREVNPLFGQPGQPYFTDSYTAGAVTPVEDYNKANGGIIALADGGKPEDYRPPEFNPAATQQYSVVRPVDPAVQAYNQQLMQRANQQYNINARPAAIQVPGSVGYGSYNPLPVVANKPADAGIGGLRYDPVNRRYIGDFEAPGNKKSDLEKMREELDALKSDQVRYNDTGGAANGGLMRSYAMGGDIGARYQSPDDMSMGDRVGAHAAVNMGPQFPMQGQYQGYASGGHLGDYSDGGRLLKGPGDGVSDDIPAQIGRRQPARLADGEFVVPARIVSELGNGSTDAGAKRLYAMMDRVQNNRRKSVGKGKVAVNSKAYKHLPV